jgi:hypothetical protein
MTKSQGNIIYNINHKAVYDICRVICICVYATKYVYGVCITLYWLIADIRY